MTSVYFYSTYWLSIAIHLSYLFSINSIIYHVCLSVYPSIHSQYPTQFCPLHILRTAMWNFQAFFLLLLNAFSISQYQATASSFPMHMNFTPFTIFLRHASPDADVAVTPTSSQQTEHVSWPPSPLVYKIPSGLTTHSILSSIYHSLPTCLLISTQ